MLKLLEKFCSKEKSNFIYLETFTFYWTHTQKKNCNEYDIICIGIIVISYMQIQLEDKINSKTFNIYDTYACFVLVKK